MVVYIYALRDPDSNAIRYIGKTTNLYKREHEHNHREGKSRKDKWIEALKKEGKEPFMEKLDECDDTNWHEKEAFYIEKYNTKKNPLLNSYTGIKYRTNTNNRKAVTQILTNGDYYIYKNQKFYKMKNNITIIMKLENGEYLLTYGKSNDYYYVFSANNEKYYIPKESNIYNENDLSILIGDINVNRYFDGIYNSTFIFMNNSTIEKFTKLLIFSIKNQSHEEILNKSKRSIFLKHLNKLDLADNFFKKGVLNLISDTSISGYRYYKSRIRDQYWSQKSQLF